jgi:CRISPR/Cas system-associated exonuclease Cas4 (RecB family)
LSFKRGYIDHEPSPDTPPLVFGSMAHICFDLVNKQINAGEFIGAELIVDQVFYDPKVRKETPLPIERYDELLRVVENMAARTVMEDSFYGSEEKFAFRRDYSECGWKDSDVFFRGAIDKLNIAGAVAWVKDYKSSFFAEYDEWQAKIYSWIILHTFPQIEEVYPNFDFPRINVELPVEPIAITRSDFNELDKQILGQIKIIENDTEFNPTPGKACDYCPYAGNCTYEIKTFDKITSDKESRQVAANVIARKTQNKRDNEALKNYVNLHGPVVCNGLEFGWNKGSWGVRKAK